MARIELNKADFTKIVDYLTWMDAMPASFKDWINMDQAERSVFREQRNGYLDIIADAVDNTDTLADLLDDYVHYTRATNEDGHMKLTTVVETGKQEILIEFVPV